MSNIASANPEAVRPHAATEEMCKAWMVDQELHPGPENAYEDFLALWKDADPDIPILNQAKAEYAKLR